MINFEVILRSSFYRWTITLDERGRLRVSEVRFRETGELDTRLTIGPAPAGATITMPEDLLLPLS